MNHTKELWECGGWPISGIDEMRDKFIQRFHESLAAHTGDAGEYVMEVYTPEGLRIAFMAGPTAVENANRIVACVNACQGIDNEHLQKIPVADVFVIIKQQRDELLAALKEVRSLILEPHSKTYSASQLINKVVAKIEGGGDA